MKKILIFTLALFSLASCSSKMYQQVLEPNVPFTDGAIRAIEIDTASINGTYQNLSQELLLFKGAAFERKDSVAGGVVYQKDIFAGDKLVVPTREFLLDNKGKKIKLKKDGFKTKPFLNEVTGYKKDPSGRFMFSEVYVSIEGGSNIGGDTFVFIPASDNLNRAASTNTRTNSRGSGGVLSLRRTVAQQQRSTQVVNTSRDSNNPFDVKYKLSLLTCNSGCDEREVRRSGFLVENGSRRIYMNYQGTIYYITVSQGGNEWFVPSDSAGVYIYGFYFKKDKTDNGNIDVAKSKRLGN